MDTLLATPPASTTSAQSPCLSVSSAAAAKVAELIADEGNPNLKLRLYVTGGGCSGFSYGFAFDDRMNDEDTRIDKDGVTVVVDMLSLQYLTGANIDYEDGLEGSRFVIHNPNAQTTCGCGSSFSM